MLLGSPATNVGQTEKKNLNKKAPKMVMDDNQDLEYHFKRF